jgi:hypothetical protein
MTQHLDDGSTAARHRHADVPAEVPEQVYKRVTALCLALPEVTLRVDESRIGTRSTAWSFDIRRRSFCLLVAVKSRNGKSRPQLLLRVDPDDREALASIGHPYFVPRQPTEASPPTSHSTRTALRSTIQGSRADSDYQPLHVVDQAGCPRGRGVQRGW